MEFGKRHDTTDFCPSQLVTDLPFMLRTCYGKTGVMEFGLNQALNVLLKAVNRLFQYSTSLFNNDYVTNAHNTLK